MTEWLFVVIYKYLIYLSMYFDKGGLSVLVIDRFDKGIHHQLRLRHRFRMVMMIHDDGGDEVRRVFWIIRPIGVY